MIGESILHYKILEQIGQGGMGVVYRAHDTKLDRTVALKFLPHGRLTSNEEKARFIREAKTASALDHPNVGTIFDIQETDDGQTFIVMAHYPGESLQQRLSRGLLPIELAVDMARQIADGLCAAHAKNILHRDIKPDNILVTDTGLLKVVDFGLARDLDATALTLGNELLGTAAYMSPEQATGKSADERTDVWALGVVLYEMLGGERPFHGDYAQALLYQVVNETPRKIGELRGDVPSDLVSIVERALAKDPSERFSTMGEMRDALVACLGARPSRSRRRNRAFTMVMVFAAIIMLGWIGSRFLRNGTDEADMRTNLLPEARKLIRDDRVTEAFFLLESAKQTLADDPTFVELLNQCSREVTVDSEPNGATVFFKDYLDTAGDWVQLGTTPVQGERLPFSYLRLRLVKDGYQTREMSFRGIWGTFQAKLIKQEDAIEGMIYIPSGQAQVGAADPIELPAYWMDKYEVTNREYQEFVDAGGYRNPAYWKHPFVLKDRTIPWDEAMTLFKDATGRDGPPKWELGHYPEGTADFPVEGVSWYEAVAYLEFVGKELPTLYHWRHAAGFGIDGEILLLSNFESDGPAPVGSFHGLSPFGNYDMAGNIQEWCWNEIRGRRYSLGGAWNAPTYAFMEMGSQAQTPFTRLPTLGFRGMKTVDPFPAVALDAIEEPIVDYDKVQPVGDDLYAVYRESFAYDRTELDARIESTTESEHWRKEKISFKAAYGQERVPAYLFLPGGVEPPYQTVVYFPGGAARTVSSSEHLLNIPYFDFVIRSGRAVLYPIYQNTYERQLGISSPGPNRKREIITQWGKDIQRAIDYLETRSDIDSEKLAYYALSLGSTYGGIFTAIEPRFRCSILLAGGLFPLPWPPDVLPINYLPRSKVPTLMVNGKYDFGLPVETSVKPMLAWMGAPEEDKKLYIFDGDHVPRANEIVRVTLDWLDRYLGAPR